tara:strand:+ start:1894 stop:2064 length:171 start_codon:yes stop_codon:yes gene_type:complete
MGSGSIQLAEGSFESIRLWVGELVNWLYNCPLEGTLGVFLQDSVELPPPKGGILIL